MSLRPSKHDPRTTDNDGKIPPDIDSKIDRIAGMEPGTMSRIVAESDAKIKRNIEHGRWERAWKSLTGREWGFNENTSPPKLDQSGTQQTQLETDRPNPTVSEAPRQPGEGRV